MTSYMDEATQVLIEMSRELDLLKVKFGEKSKLYQTKLHQLDVLMNMQDGAVKTINNLNHALKLALLNQAARDMAEELMVESFANQIHTEGLKNYLHLLKP